MSNLSYRQQKIQGKRKQTPWRDFVMEICSWMPIILYKNNGLISVYPDNGKISIIENSEFHNNREYL